MGEYITRPFSGIQVTASLALIGADDEVAQNEYSNSAQAALIYPISGTVTRVGLYTAVTGTGAVLTPAGTLYLLSADPEVAAGDVALTAAEWATMLGETEFAAGDWFSDANGGVVHADVSWQFQTLSNLYVVWFHADATGFNDAAGDDETLACKLWYKPYG